MLSGLASAGAPQGLAEIVVEGPTPLVQQHADRMGFPAFPDRVFDTADAIEADFLRRFQHSVTGRLSDRIGAVDDTVDRGHGNTCRFGQIGNRWARASLGAHFISFHSNLCLVRFDTKETSVVSSILI